MKKLFVFLTLMFLAIPAFADEPVVTIPSGVTVKQGFIIPWENPQSGFMNMSTVTIMQTEKWEKIGMWNLLWEGWSVDGAWSYDANTSVFGVMLGRHMGTLGKYLPISYPLADHVDITLYPVGIMVDSPFDQPEVGGASGAAIIKFDVSF